MALGPNGEHVPTGRKIEEGEAAVGCCAGGEGATLCGHLDGCTGNGLTRGSAEDASPRWYCRLLRPLRLNEEEALKDAAQERNPCSAVEGVFLLHDASAVWSPIFDQTARPNRELYEGKENPGCLQVPSTPPSEDYIEVMARARRVGIS